MRFYLDSSAIVKLVQREPESDALREFLGGHGTDDSATSALARVEVVRAVSPGGLPAVALAQRQLGRLYQVPLDVDLLDRAATVLAETPLRSLDAVHLVSAQLLGREVAAVITYDRRMQDAAEALGLSVEAPV